MKLKHLAFSMSVSAVLVTPVARADGSVSFAKDIAPILRSRPVFERFINQAFSVTDTGWGVRINSPTMPHMGGARMGPYRFSALWRSPSGDVPVTLVIDTQVRYFDVHHKEIKGSDLRRTVSIKETLDSIEVEPPQNGTEGVDKRD
jgi:hypothetical protein